MSELTDGRTATPDQLERLIRIVDSLSDVIDIMVIQSWLNGNSQYVSVSEEMNGNEWFVQRMEVKAGIRERID